MLLMIHRLYFSTQLQLYFEGLIWSLIGNGIVHRYQRWIKMNVIQNNISDKHYHDTAI
jgi:hypothetical protein